VNTISTQTETNSAIKLELLELQAKVNVMQNEKDQIAKENATLKSMV
jgi:hypothetical protein